MLYTFTNISVNHEDEETMVHVKKQKTESAGIIKPKKKPARNTKQTKIQVAFENVMAEYTKCQKESDQMFVSHMKNQIEKELKCEKKS